MLPPARHTHKFRNLVQSALLIIGMATIAGACAWTVWGWEGVLWTSAGVVLAMVLSPRLPSGLVLSMYKARPLSPQEYPEGFELLAALAVRAELPQTPQLFYISSAAINAFSVGRRGSAAIAVTDGLLRILSRRELANVFAHEITHIRNNDLWIMNLADAMGRMTWWLSYFGILLMILNLPSLFAGETVVSWLLVALLISAPTVMALLQLALSRAREYEADRGAAELTGDPLGMASALEKMERRQGGFWEDIMLPGPRIPDPSLLRTHPKSGERIRRLVELAKVVADDDERHAHSPVTPPAHDTIKGRPRMRWPGVWY